MYRTKKTTDLVMFKTAYKFVMGKNSISIEGFLEFLKKLAELKQNGGVYSTYDTGNVEVSFDFNGMGYEPDEPCDFD